MSLQSPTTSATQPTRAKRKRRATRKKLRMEAYPPIFEKRGYTVQLKYYQNVLSRVFVLAPNGRPLAEIGLCPLGSSPDTGLFLTSNDASAAYRRYGLQTLFYNTRHPYFQADVRTFVYVTLPWTFDDFLHMVDRLYKEVSTDKYYIASQADQLLAQKINDRSEGIGAFILRSNTHE